MRVDDGWKDTILSMPYITNEYFSTLSEREQNWIRNFPDVFAYVDKAECRYNLLHRDNKKLKGKIGKSVI